MHQLKVAVILGVAVILQSSLPEVWLPLRYIDFVLIVVVYLALQRDVMQALMAGAAGGLLTDALGGGLLGAGGFSKTLVAYLIASLATRVMLDNPLVRIPVLAGAALLDSTVYVILHRLLGQPSLMPFVEAASYRLIGTTVLGTAIFYLFDTFFSERARQRRQLAVRRRVARRGRSILKLRRR